MIWEGIFQFLAAAVGTVAFSVMFYVPKEYYLNCGIIGGSGWIIYWLGTGRMDVSAFFATLVATVFVAAASRFEAARKKCPATLFLLPVIFPLVPGISIYRTVYYLIMDETRALFDAGHPKEILTVDNHADGPYVWMRLKREDPKRAEEVFELLQYNEGNNSGRGIGCISWDGKVHADQFWREHVFGNVLERPFSQIWDDPDIELLHKLKNKKVHVGGRCAKCKYLNICGGNFRARAEAFYGDEWAQDPACYLTDEEIGL